MPKGGKRAGAGRPVGTRKPHYAVATDIAREVLTRVDAVKIWCRLLRSRSPKIVFATLQYLTDRAYGRPVQMIAGDPNKPVEIQLNWAQSPDWLTSQTTINQQIVHVQSAKLLAKALALESHDDDNDNKTET